jgi:hypothetical protein
MPERIPLLEALLDVESEESHGLARQILAADTAHSLYTTVLRTISLWNGSQILDSVFLEASEIPTRIDAALYLGLRGKLEAVEFLNEVARGEDARTAAEACQKLAWLAQPSAIEPLDRLLLHDDGNVVWIALGAASTLKASDLIHVLLETARRKLYTDGLHVPLCDEAIRVTGSLLVPGFCDDLPEEFERNEIETYTDGYRQKIVSHYATCVSLAKKHHRYTGGELLRLGHLTQSLFSPHSGAWESAAFNLHAITGKRYGFDYSHYADLITNLPAIQSWREYGQTHNPLTPGGWAFQGKSQEFR